MAPGAQRTAGNHRGAGYPWEATTTLPASAWSYDPITQVLRVSGPAGAALAVQYGWIGRQPSLDAFAAIWHR